MIPSEQNSAVRISYQLSDIQKAVEGKEYPVALAMIREVQSSNQLDDMSFEAGEFYRLSAKTFYYLGSYQEALEAGQEAISIFIRLHDELKIAESQFVLGLAYIGMGNLKSAETEMRDALTAHRRAGDFTGAIGCLSRLANIEFIKGNYFKSIEYLQDALAWAGEMAKGQERASLCGNLGVMFLMMGRWHEAEKNLLLNIKLNRQTGNEINLCKGLLSLGYIYFAKRKFSTAKETYGESFSLIQKNNCVRELAIYHEYSGELAFVQQDYQVALEHYTKAIEIGEKIAPNSGIISQTYRLLADLQVAKKEYDSALSSCQRALRVSISLGERVEEAACYRILGQIYTVKGDKQKAQENFNKSLNILEDIKAKYELAKTYLETGKSSCFDQYERLKYLGRAEDIFKELESKYHLGSVDFALSQLFFENREYEKSELYLKDAEKVFKELKDEKDLKQILEFKKKLGRLTGTAGAAEPERRYAFSDIITRNKTMLDILEKSKQIKDTNMTILIEGETGTGKDLLAKCIHFESKRKGKKFVVVNCPAIPHELLESELFGHRKGAFTSSSYDKQGLLEEADQGTLFLNEVADLPWLVQAKLLGVIENKEFTRLGETKPRKVDFRVIAVSNKDLEEEVKAGRFRSDLYYRLKVIKFVLPPLRERKEDIPLLVRHLMSVFSNNGSQISLQALESFSHRDWSGNIRELENEVRNHAALGEDETIGNGVDGNSLSRNENNCLSSKLAGYEREQIVKALKDSDGIKIKAAKLLGIPWTTLHNKIKKYNIESPD